MASLIPTTIKELNKYNEYQFSDKCETVASILDRLNELAMMPYMNDLNTLSIKCKDYDLHIPSIIKTINELKKENIIITGLILKNNKFEIIHDLDFSDLSINFLDLSENKLEKLPKLPKSLRRLKLDNNKIKEKPKLKNCIITGLKEQKHEIIVKDNIFTNILNYVNYNSSKILFIVFLVSIISCSSRINKYEKDKYKYSREAVVSKIIPIENKEEINYSFLIIWKDNKEKEIVDVNKKDYYYFKENQKIFFKRLKPEYVEKNDKNNTFIIINGIISSLLIIYLLIRIDL